MLLVMRWLKRWIPRCLLDSVAGRLGSIACALEIAALTIFAVRLSFVTFLLTTATCVTTSLGAIAELPLPFLRI
jgi:hypothetical protein